MSATQEVGEIFGEGTGPATALLRSPTVIIASVGFWGMNIYLFRRIGIDYARVLLLDLVREREEKAARQRRGRGMGSGGVVGGDPCDGPGGADGANGAPPPKGGSADDLDKLDKRSDCGDDVGDALGHDHEMELAPLDTDGTLSQTAAGKHMHEQHDRDGTTGFTDEESTLTSAGGAGSTSTAAGSSATSGSPSPSKPTGDAEPAPQPHEVTARRCLSLSLCLLALLHLTKVLWINALGGGTIGAIFAFYALVTIGIVIPISSTRWVRVAVRTVLHRAAELLNPRCSCLGGELRAIPFIDVFFADAMCSLSKVFFDWGMLWHLASHYPDPVPPSVHAIVIPSLCASLPYVIRARQCIIMHTVGKRKNDPKRYQHLLNAAKYSTSLFPICVSALQKTVDDKQASQLEKFLIVLLVVNSLYALAWDIVMDWGMMSNPTAVVAKTCAPGVVGVATEVKDKDCTHHCLRPRLRFGTLTSVGILLADCVLRFAWLLRFYEHALFPNTDVYILWTELLEAFRRAIWNLLRVEWENIKQTKAKKQRGKEEEQAPFITPKLISLNSMNRGF